VALGDPRRGARTRLLDDDLVDPARQHPHAAEQEERHEQDPEQAALHRRILSDHPIGGRCAASNLSRARA
jgi:hypothetical protein